MTVALRPDIRAMRGYSPGEQFNDPDIIKLNTNENPYPPSPRVFEAVKAALTGDRLRKYPQPMGDSFRKIAERVLGVDPESILPGNGSDDILTILTRAFAPAGGLVVAPTPSYSLYSNLAEIQGARFESISFSKTWTLPHPWPKEGSNLTFLPNPNSPSGTVLTSDAIRKIATAVNPHPLVLDEAYADFAEWNGLALQAAVPNLIVTRSFSKAYSLAGIRFGFAVACPSIIRELVKVKDSYNCDVLSLAAAGAALEDQEYFRGTRKKVLATRERMRVELTDLHFEVTPSHANFLWCRRPSEAVKPIYEELKRRKILVRYMEYDGYEGLRISVGTESEIDALLQSLRALV